MKKIISIVSVALLSASIFTGCASNENDEVKDSEVKVESESLYSNPEASTPEEALSLLKEGNQRFVKGEQANFDLGEKKIAELNEGQSPYAVVVACSDSRVAPELFLDQGLGEIFVIRVAGNVLDKDEIASIEYAVDHLDTPLVAVLGHEHCGAVTAAVEAHGDSEAHGLTESLSHLLGKITPAVEKAKASDVSEDKLTETAIDLNVDNSIEELKAKSPVIQERLESGKLEVVGGNYRLSNGEVIWNK